MKFKTRLQVTFLIILILPIVLVAFAFYGIGMFLTDGRDTSLKGFDAYHARIEEMVFEADNVYDLLKKQMNNDSSLLLDKEYISDIDDNSGRKSTFLIVRKGSEIIYNGNIAASRLLLDQLPVYDSESCSEENGIYFDDSGYYVKHMDFVEDGVGCSVFVVSNVQGLISKKFLIDMMIAMGLIMLLTSILLTRWIKRTLFDPINQVNIAMQQIREGNLEFMLPTEFTGEIGDLYRNYEDMRLTLKETTEMNRQAEEKNRELISNISHDLKTPITAVKGYVEGIMDGVADTPEKIDKYIKTIYNKANDMEKLINELTYYSRIDTNRIPYNFQTINVADYFGDCVEEVGIDLEQRNITLNYTNVTSPDTLVIADAEQMKKVINNIISNSVKYMDKQKGYIEIRILDQAESIQVEIEDNGKGIAQKDLGSIFDRFFRTDASRNSAQGGSGIGLSIVRKIIEDHGGYIWATSKEGEGTCIHFVLRKYIELQHAE